MKDTGQHHIPTNLPNASKGYPPLVCGIGQVKAVLGRLRASVWGIRSWQRRGAQSRRAVSTQAVGRRMRGASSSRAAGIIEPLRTWFWTLPKASYVIWTNHFSRSLRFFICKMGAITLMLPASQRCRRGMVISAHWAQAVVATAPPKAPHCSPAPRSPYPACPSYAGRWTAPPQ